METAGRSPIGTPFKDGKKTTGVPYTPPVGPQPGEEINEPPQLSSLTPDGRQEIPDGVPMEPPLGYSNGPSLADFVQRMIRGEISKAAADMEFETFEEAEDFDIEDDPIDPLTPYEKVFEPPPSPPAPPTSSEAVGGAGGEGGDAGPAPPSPPATTEGTNETTR